MANLAELLDDFTWRNILHLAARNDAGTERSIRVTCRRFREIIGPVTSVNVVYILLKLMREDNFDSFHAILRGISDDIIARRSVNIRAQTDIIDNLKILLKQAYSNEIHHLYFAHSLLDFLSHHYNRDRLTYDLLDYHYIPRIDHGKYEVSHELNRAYDSAICHCATIYAKLCDMRINWLMVEDLPMYDLFNADQVIEFLQIFTCNKLSIRDYVGNKCTRHIIEIVLAHVIRYLAIRRNGDRETCCISPGRTEVRSKVYDIDLQMIAQFLTKVAKNCLLQSNSTSTSRLLIDYRELIAIYVAEQDESTSVSHKADALDSFVETIEEQETLCNAIDERGTSLMQFPLYNSSTLSCPILDDITDKFAQEHISYAQINYLGEFIVQNLISCWSIDAFLARSYRGITIKHSQLHMKWIANAMVGKLRPREFEKGILKLMPYMKGNAIALLLRYMIVNFHRIQYPYQFARILFQCYNPGTHGQWCVAMGEQYHSQFVNYLRGINTFPNLTI